MTLETAVALTAFALLFVTAFLAAAETALSRIDRFRAAALADEGRRGAKALVHLVDSPEHFSGYLNGVLLLLSATRIVAATAVAYLAFEWLDGPWVVAAIVAEVVVGYVLSEAVPKTWAIEHPERAALVSAPIVKAILRVLPVRLISRPLIWTANKLLPGKGLAEGPFIYEQQILALADTAAQNKAIQQEEHALIHSVIEFGTTIAREVMVPRTDMTMLGVDCTASQAIDVAIGNGYSRMPVHGESNDEILGTLFTKDLLRAVHSGEGDGPIKPLLKPIKFVPETKRVAELMPEMQREKVHMSIVIDEHGGVVGLVTLEDLIEEVVGEITDEYDVEDAPHIEVLGEQDWRIDARMLLDEINDELKLDLPTGDWDTVGGLLIDDFGRVPSRGDKTRIADYGFTVEQTSGRRITRVRLKVEPVMVDEVDDPVSSARH